VCGSARNDDLTFGVEIMGDHGSVKCGVLSHLPSNFVDLCSVPLDDHVNDEFSAPF
jgi:hypothetical protein